MLSPAQPAARPQGDAPWKAKAPRRPVRCTGGAGKTRSRWTGKASSLTRPKPGCRRAATRRSGAL